MSSTSREAAEPPTGEAGHVAGLGPHYFDQPQSRATSRKQNHVRERGTSGADPARVPQDHRLGTSAEVRVIWDTLLKRVPTQPAAADQPSSCGANAFRMLATGSGWSAH